MTLTRPGIQFSGYGYTLLRVIGHSYEIHLVNLHIWPLVVRWKKQEDLTVHYNPSHKTNQVLDLCVFVLLIFQNAFSEDQLCARPVEGWQVEGRVGACVLEVLLIYFKAVEKERKGGLCSLVTSCEVGSLEATSRHSFFIRRKLVWENRGNMLRGELSLTWILNSSLTCLPASTLALWIQELWWPLK